MWSVSLFLWSLLLAHFLWRGGKRKSKVIKNDGPVLFNGNVSAAAAYCTKSEILFGSGTRKCFLHSKISFGLYGEENLLENRTSLSFPPVCVGVLWAFTKSIIWGSGSQEVGSSSSSNESTPLKVSLESFSIRKSHNSNNMNRDSMKWGTSLRSKWSLCIINSQPKYVYST